jgi:PKD repeat protein
VITVDLVRGVAPLRVSFSSNRSTDDGLIVARLWDFGDGTTSPEISPAHTYETTGTFTVQLTLTDDDGATSQTTTTVRVTRAPIARISVNATELPTAPGRLLFDATASTDPDGTIVSYQWDFGDGSRESLSEVAHTFASSGTFNVRLTVTDNVGITGTDEVVIRVGIRQPEIEFRLPPEDAALIVVPQDSAIWVEGVFNVEPGVPRRIIAGLDRDQDLCDAKGLLLPVDSLEVRASSTSGTSTS